MAKQKREPVDAHQIVTDAVINFLEKNEAENAGGKWTRPWVKLLGETHYCPATGKVYNGFVNTLCLSVLAAERGFTSNAWGTFKQWLSLGTDEAPVCVRKGSKGSYIFKPTMSKRQDAAGDDFMVITGWMQYAVFNAEDVDGYTEIKPEAPASKVVDNSVVDGFLANLDMDFSHGGDRAYYSPPGDHVRMPAPEAFVDTPFGTATESYYGTRLHETIHWTGHSNRCNRDLSGGKGSTEYAFEELVAEMGAAILCNMFGVSDSPRDDHSQYIKSWLTALKNDKEFVIEACKKSQQAIKWLEKQQPVKV